MPNAIGETLIGCPHLKNKIKNRKTVSVRKVEKYLSPETVYPTLINLPHLLFLRCFWHPSLSAIYARHLVQSL